MYEGVDRLIVEDINSQEIDDEYLISIKLIAFNKNSYCYQRLIQLSNTDNNALQLKEEFESDSSSDSDSGSIFLYSEYTQNNHITTGAINILSQFKGVDIPTNEINNVIRLIELLDLYWN